MQSVGIYLNKIDTYLQVQNHAYYKECKQNKAGLSAQVRKLNKNKHGNPKSSGFSKRRES